MGERLPRGIRIHNRREKSLARRQGRKPVLIGFTLPSVMQKTEPLLGQLQTLHYSPTTPSIGTDAGRLPKAITETPIKKPFTEPTVGKQRKQPTDMSFMEAGMRLSSGARSIRPNDEESHEDLNDQQAIRVLEDLEDGIRSGKILSSTVIARQALRLGSKMGMFGSATTEIDIAAWRVLDAIRENKEKFTD